MVRQKEMGGEKDTEGEFYRVAPPPQCFPTRGAEHCEGEHMEFIRHKALNLHCACKSLSRHHSFTPNHTDGCAVTATHVSHTHLTLSRTHVTHHTHTNECSVSQQVGLSAGAGTVRYTAAASEPRESSHSHTDSDTNTDTTE